MCVRVCLIDVAPAGDDATSSQLSDWDDSVQDLDITGHESSAIAAAAAGLGGGGGVRKNELAAGKSESLEQSRDDYSMSLSEDTPSFVRGGGSFGKVGEGGAGTGAGAHAHSGMHAKRAPSILQKSPVRLKKVLY